MTGAGVHMLKRLEAGWVGRVAVLFLFLCSTAFGGDPPSRLKALQVEYETTGVLPGSNPQEGKTSVLQRITVDESVPRLRFEEFPTKAGGEAGHSGVQKERVFILRADKAPPVIWEILEGGKRYREHSGDLNESQKDRRITEENEIQLAKKLTPKEFGEWKKENPYLRLDGSREVKVTREPGEKILGRTTEHIVVTENGRTIVDAYVTKDVPRAGTYYRLYRRLGAFSEEVLEKLSGIDGLPLRAKVTVVTALPTYEFQVEAKNLSFAEIGSDAFELHQAKKVEDSPRNALCSSCGKPVDTENAPAKLFYEGKQHFFCSETCSEDFLDRNSPKGEERADGRPKK